MTDREKVIKGLEKCKRHECDDCTEEGASQAPWDCPAYDNFVDCALALLKDQEPVKPTYENFFGNRIARCGKCNGYIVRYRYCPGCGQEVKWDE